MADGLWLMAMADGPWHEPSTMTISHQPLAIETSLRLSPHSQFPPNQQHAGGVLLE